MAEQKQTQAMSVQQKRNDLAALLKQMQPQLQLVLPKHMTPEKMTRIALTAWSKTPELLDCNPQSIAACVMTASELALELSGPLGQAYMVPRWNKKTQSKEATFQVGYRGLIDLAMRNGRVRNFSAHVVHLKDTFYFRYGTSPKLDHEPTAQADKGPVTHVYAVAIQTNGGYDFEVMSFQEIVEFVEKYVDMTSFSPWKTAWDEMAKKTVIRRLSKRLPMSIQYAEAVVADEAPYLRDSHFTAIGQSAQADPMMSISGPATIDDVKKQAEAEAAAAGKKEEAGKKDEEHGDSYEGDAETQKLVDELVPKKEDPKKEEAKPSKQRRQFDQDEGLR